MAQLVADCPRCGSRSMTFDVRGAHVTGEDYGWQWWYEAFSVCRHCKRATIFILSDSREANHDELHKAGLQKIDRSLNSFVDIEGFVSLKDHATVSPPEHIPQQISAAFQEGATCLAVGCYNAAGAMFRLCVDIATRDLLPTEDLDGLNAKVRRNLGLRLPWLFAHAKLPRSLEGLSSCIREDGNDGAHAGTLGKPDAEDLLDFTVELLERVFTDPRRLELAKERRGERRKPR